MKVLDRAFGCLMVLGGIGHGFGSYNAYRNDAMALLWALSASFAVILLTAVNLLRAGRKGDRSLAWISFARCVVWIGFVVCFGRLIGNMFDFRPLVNLIVTGALASLASAVRFNHAPESSVAINLELATRICVTPLADSLGGGTYASLCKRKGRLVPVLRG